MTRLHQVFNVLWPSSYIATRNGGLIICSIFIVLPVSLQRSMSHLSWTSLISFVAHLIIVVVVVFCGGQAASDVVMYVLYLCVAFSTIYIYIYIYSCIGILLKASNSPLK